MNIDEKLVQFSLVAINAAKEEKESKLKALNEQFIKSCENKRISLEENANSIIKREKYNAERERNKKIINATVESRKALIKRREELISQLFDNVISKINSFIKSDNYKEWLINSIRDAKILLGDNNIKVVLNESDKGIASDISGATGADIEFSNVNFIGGCKIISKSKNRLVDNTFKSRIEKERQSFNKLKIRD